MRIWILTAVLTLLATATLDARQPPGPHLPSVDLPPELERVLRDYETAWSARDPAALAAAIVEAPPHGGMISTTWGLDVQAIRNVFWDRGAHGQ